MPSSLSPQCDASTSAASSSSVAADNQATTIPATNFKLGVVVIGRNEGERLRRCLQSLTGVDSRFVYVDSGSVDGSVQLASGLQGRVVELDLSQPFTAARARNEGFSELMKAFPRLELVQFVDGDCEIAAEWLGRAAEACLADDRCAIVCGRRRERFPDSSLYNRLCDMEWDQPVGETTWCGGDFLMRASAFRELGGFNPEMIAGEEPELCSRLLAAGWKVLRIDGEMTLHDAAITRFSQCWRRNVRSGHAMAELAYRQGRHWSVNGLVLVRSLMIWTVLVPLAALIVAFFNLAIAASFLMGAYLLQWWRITRKQQARGYSFRHGAQYALLILVGKFAELLGAARYLRNNLRRRKSGLIEYK